MIYLTRRIYETLTYHIISSFIVSLLFYFGILPQGYKLSVLMLGISALFDIIAVIFFTAIYYKYTQEDTKTFYKTNLLAVSLLIACANLLAILDSVVSMEPIYTFLFFPFKLGMIAIGMSKFVSAFTLGIILLFAAAVPPLFLRKVIIEEEPMPPMMKIENNEKKVSE